MQGKIVRWVDDRAFGFIQEPTTGVEIFAHISVFEIQNPPPKVGEIAVITQVYLIVSLIVVGRKKHTRHRHRDLVADGDRKTLDVGVVDCLPHEP